MLDWLKKLGDKPDHPMHSVEEAKQLISYLPDDALKALEEVSSWLTTVTAATGFRPAARVAIVKLLDETGQPLVRRVAEPLTSPELKPFKRLQLAKSALHFWESSETAYRSCFDELQRDPKRGGLQQKDIAPVIVRALRALGAKDKVLHMRYEPASEDKSQSAHIDCELQSGSDLSPPLVRRVPIRRAVWEPMFNMYRLSETLHCELQPMKLYAHEASPTNAKQELLRALMLQAASPEAMSPRQVELAARATAHFASSFLLSPTSDAACKWYCDLVQLEPAARGAAEPMTRFFGAGVVLPKIEHLVAQLAAEPDKANDGFGEDYSPQEKIVVLKHLLSHWGEPPLRREARPPRHADVVAAHGFAAACELVPRIASASEAGPALELDNTAAANLGVDVATDAADIVLEQWLERDSGPWGLGTVLPPKSESWITIGALCTFRIADGPWTLGVVRRLYRDSTKQLFAGIEILSKKPAFVRLRNISGEALLDDKWDPESVASQSQMAAILLQESANAEQQHELLAALGHCIPGAVYEWQIADQLHQLKLEEMLEQSTDFDRARFTWIK